MATTDLRQGHAKVISQCWEEEERRASGRAAIATVRGLGNFVKMDWKLGLTMKSSNATDTSATPFVTVVLHFTNETAGAPLRTQCFEMTLPQFKEFARSVRAMSVAFDSI